MNRESSWLNIPHTGDRSIFRNHFGGRNCPHFFFLYSHHLSIVCSQQSWCLISFVEEIITLIILFSICRDYFHKTNECSPNPSTPKISSLQAHGKEELLIESRVASYSGQTLLIVWKKAKTTQKIVLMLVCIQPNSDLRGC